MAERKPLEIYFACSIRGEQGGQEEKQMIVDIMKGLGHTVLSEIFVGQDRNVNQAQVVGPQAIYEQDMKWVNDADLIVADVSRISTGVGMEIGWKLRAGEPVLGLCREDRYKDISNMLKGCTASHYALHTWQTKLDLQAILTSNLGKVFKHG